MSGRRAFDPPGGDNVRIPAPSGPPNKSPERATTAFQNIDEMKRKEELFKQKLLAAEKDLAAAKEHARIKSMAPPLRGQSAAHEMHIEIFLPNADNSRQLILPGQLLVSQVKNAVWTSFASELSGTTQAEFDLCLSVSTRLQEDAELREAHPSAAEAYRAWRPLKLYLYPIDDERRRKLDEQRREEAHLREEAARRRRRAEENERRRVEEEQKLLAASGGGPPPPVPRPASPPRGVIASVPALNTAAIADADRAARSISPPPSQEPERSLSPRGKSVRIGAPDDEPGTGNSPREESATSPRKSVFGALLKELQPKSRSTRNLTILPCKYGDRCQDNSKDHRTRFTHSAAATVSGNPNPNPNAVQPSTSYAQLATSNPNISFVHEADEVDVVKAAAGVGARAKSPERGRVGLSAQEAMRPASPERAASPGRRQLSEAEKQELRLNQLASLGYADVELNTKYLAENNGNVAATSAALQRHYAERKPLPPLPTRAAAQTNPPVPAIANLVTATEKVHLSDPGLAPPAAGVPASNSGEALPPMPSRPAPVSPRTHYVPASVASPLSSVSTPNLHSQLLDHQAKVAANSTQTPAADAPVAKDPSSARGVPSPRVAEERKLVNNNNNELSTSVKPSDLRARGILSPTRSERTLPQPQARQAILSPPRAATVSSGAQPPADAQRREAELLEKISALEKVNAELRRTLAQSQESSVADTAKLADAARRLALTEARAAEAERQVAAKDAMLIEKERELASLRAQVIAAQAASPPPSPAASAPLAATDAEAKIRALEEKNATLNQKLEVVGKALKLFKAEKEKFKQTEEELRATQDKLAYLQNLIKARAGTGAAQP